MELKVEGFDIYTTIMPGSFCIALKAAGNVLEIVIGNREAQYIAAVRENVVFKRPQTQDLLVNLVDAFGFSVEKVVVTELKGNTYYAVLYLQKDGASLKIDCRPSDGIAVALRSKCDIYISHTVFDQEEKSRKAHELQQELVKEVKF